VYGSPEGKVAARVADVPARFSRSISMQQLKGGVNRYVGVEATRTTLSPLHGLRRQIRDGLFDEPGAPGELQLARQNDVARVAVRRAIANLVAEGLVSFRAGVGTTVNRTHVSRTATVNHSGGLLENLVTAVAITSIRVATFGVCPCPPDVAQALWKD
jgi:hypothetical protein